MYIMIIMYGTRSPLLWTVPWTTSEGSARGHDTREKERDSALFHMQRFTFYDTVYPCEAVGRVSVSVMLGC